MPSIFDGCDEIVDGSLSLDETWSGTFPRYVHKATVQRLCRDDFPEVDGLKLVHQLYDKIVENWQLFKRNGPPSTQNWRFEKRTKFAPDYRQEEPILERTIAGVTDDANWANQIPVDSGLVSRKSHHLDLAFRSGTSVSLIELKYRSNTPLAAAVQVLEYGLAYAFFRTHAEILGCTLKDKRLIEASEVNLKVLAPHNFYSNCGPSLGWLKSFEESIDDGLVRFSNEIQDVPPMTFAFEAFPKDFRWDYRNADDLATQKNVLWAVHRRAAVFA